MGRRAALLATAFMLAACGEMDLSKFTVLDVVSNKLRLELESEPPGAEAKSSLGPSCHTPCSLSLAVDSVFTVTFALEGYQPQTVAIAKIYVRSEAPNQGNLPAHADLDPNPVRALLVALPPPPPPEPPPKVKKKPRVAAKPANQ
jgi:hypothetical protein